MIQALAVVGLVILVLASLCLVAVMCAPSLEEPGRGQSLD
jgi:hypothetical protein